MDYMLTTLDNPYNPHHDFDQWLAFDHDHGYYSSQLLGRIARTSDELSDADNELAMNDAINEIIHEDLIGIYIKVDSNFKPKPIQLVA